MSEGNTKANASDFLGRYREIVSDPLNVLIKRCPEAGLTVDDNVVLHNGIKVPYKGIHSYYDNFSDILVINRGVHEPLEEFVFQQVLKSIKCSTPTMLELGAYWGHYSLWLSSAFPKANLHLVEPESTNIEAGKYNFNLNGKSGNFIQSFVGKDSFSVDEFIHKNNFEHLTILHSDIQGYELEMLDDCKETLQSNLVDYVFVSTHSQNLHENVVLMLKSYGYRVEVSSDFEHHSTSFDGFVFASNTLVSPVFDNFKPLGRESINKLSPIELTSYIGDLAIWLDSNNLKK